MVIHILVSSSSHVFIGYGAYPTTRPTHPPHFFYLISQSLGWAVFSTIFVLHKLHVIIPFCHCSLIQLRTQLTLQLYHKNEWYMYHTSVAYCIHISADIESVIIYVYTHTHTHTYTHTHTHAHTHTHRAAQNGESNVWVAV